MATSFMRSVRHSYDDKDYKIAAFFLHQVCENLYHAINLIFTPYSYKLHDLDELSKAAKTHCLEIAKVFPRSTEEEERLFQLLLKAYIEARYNKDYVATKEDIEALIPRVELFAEITKKACEERVKEYVRRSRTEK